MDGRHFAGEEFEAYVLSDRLRAFCQPCVALDTHSVGLSGFPGTMTLHVNGLKALCSRKGCKESFFDRIRPLAFLSELYGFHT